MPRMYLALKLLVTGEPPMKRLGTDVGRMARDLNALFKIAKTINSLRSLESFGSHLLQLIGEVIPADSGAILIIPHIDEEPSSIITWNRDGRRTQPAKCSPRGCASCLMGAFGSSRRLLFRFPVVRSGCCVYR